MRSVVGDMRLIRLERDRLGHLDRLRRDPDVNAEVAKAGHEPGIELGDRHGLECHGEHPAVAVGDAESMVDEVEIDLELATAARDRRRRQASCADVQRHVPPMVEWRRHRHAHLADDLNPHMEGIDRRPPLSPGKLRPGSARFATNRACHCQCSRSCRSGGTPPAGPGTAWRWNHEPRRPAIPRIPSYSAGPQDRCRRLPSSRQGSGQGRCPEATAASGRNSVASGVGSCTRRSTRRYSMLDSGRVRAAYTMIGVEIVDQ